MLNYTMGMAYYTLNKRNFWVDEVITREKEKWGKALKKFFACRDTQKYPLIKVEGIVELGNSSFWSIYVVLELGNDQ